MIIFKIKTFIGKPLELTHYQPTSRDFFLKFLHPNNELLFPCFDRKEHVIKGGPKDALENISKTLHVQIFHFIRLNSYGGGWSLWRPWAVKSIL